MPESWVLCAGTIPRASFADRVDAAAEAGFAAITLFPEHYLHAVGREGLDPSAIHRLLQGAGIAVHQLDPLLDWYSNDATSSELRLYEAAEATGATSLNVAPAFAPTKDLSFLTDRLGALGDRAAVRGLSIDLEFLPWSPIPDLGTAISVVEACGRRTLGARDLVRLTRNASQSADQNLIGETLTRRLLPGDGEQPLAELLAALEAGGCRAPAGVEVFNSALHRLPAREAARRAMDACLRVAP